MTVFNEAPSPLWSLGLEMISWRLPRNTQPDNFLPNKTTKTPCYCPESMFQLGTCRMHHLLAMSLFLVGYCPDFFCIIVAIDNFSFWYAWAFSNSSACETNRKMEMFGTNPSCSVPSILQICRVSQQGIHTLCLGSSCKLPVFLSVYQARIWATWTSSEVAFSESVQQYPKACVVSATYHLVGRHCTCRGVNNETTSAQKHTLRSAKIKVLPALFEKEILRKILLCWFQILSKQVNRWEMHENVISIGLWIIWEFGLPTFG